MKTQASFLSFETAPSVNTSNLNPQTVRGENMKVKSKTKKITSGQTSSGMSGLSPQNIIHKYV